MAAHIRAVFRTGAEEGQQELLDWQEPETCCRNRIRPTALGGSVKTAAYRRCGFGSIRPYVLRPGT